MTRVAAWVCGCMGVWVSLGTGCAPQPKTLTVFAAASLTGAFRAMQPEFERTHPGVKVRFNFGASSHLRTQIEQGAPADVFAAADYVEMRPLVAARSVTVPQTFARNRLVIVTPLTNPGRLRTPADLARAEVRVVMAGEAVPIARYTRRVLLNLGRLEGYGLRFQRRVTQKALSREANVRSVLTKVELGEADAGIVYETDAAGSSRVNTLRIPEPANVTAEYPIAIVTATRQPKAADAWIAFVLSRAGQDVLKRYGFR